jgi:hypothetical protein
MLPVLFSDGEESYHFAIEGRNIIGLATCNQSMVGDYFLIHPGSSGVLNIGFQ